MGLPWLIVIFSLRDTQVCFWRHTIQCLPFINHLGKLSIDQTIWLENLTICLPSYMFYDNVSKNFVNNKNLPLFFKHFLTLLPRNWHFAYLINNRKILVSNSRFRTYFQCQKFEQKTYSYNEYLRSKIDPSLNKVVFDKVLTKYTYKQF